MATIQRVGPVGIIQTIAVPNPGAGNNISVTNTGGALFELLYLKCLYTAAAGGGNRRTSLRFTINTQPMDTGQIHDTVAASSTNIFRWEAGGHEYFDFSAINETYQAFPRGIILDFGDTFALNTVNFQAADTFTDVVAFIMNYHQGI